MNSKYYNKWDDVIENLQVADIILTTKYKSIFSRSIRKATKSNWSHVALILKIPEETAFNKKILIVEAVKNGIQIHRIQKYTRHRDKFDIGVKRVPGLSEKTRKKVLAYMLNNVDTPYNYTRLLLNLLQTVNILAPKTSSKIANSDDLVCSTFTQKAFFNAVPANKKKDMIFRENEVHVEHIEDLAPAEIANSNKAIWLYNKKP